MARYYKHSGSFSAAAPLVMLAIGAIAAVIGGVVYAYAAHYIPFFIVTLLLVFGFGAGMGFAVSTAARIGKLRHTPMLLMGAAFCGAMALYADWVVHIYLLTERFFVAPGDLASIMQLMAQTGVWEVEDIRPTGWALYAFWGAEALIVCGMTVFIPYSALGALPFCERCDAWIEDVVLLQPFEPNTDEAGLKAAFERDPASAMAQLEEAEVEYDVPFLRAELRQCEGCHDMQLLTLSAVTIDLDSDGDVTESASAVVENLLIDTTSYDAILSGE